MHFIVLGFFKRDQIRKFYRKAVQVIMLQNEMSRKNFILVDTASHVRTFWYGCNRELEKA